MKQLYTLILLLFIGFSANAQKVSDDDINFEYRRLPAEPLDKSFTNYQSKVELSYAGENAAKKEDAEAKYQQDVKDYPQKVKDAEAKYKENMKEWEVEDKNAEDKYQKEVAEWNKKSTMQKVASKQLANEGKPHKQGPSKPSKNLPSEPYKQSSAPTAGQKDHDVNLLANTYLILEGFKNTSDNAVIVTASVGAFDCIKPDLKTETRKMTKTVSGKQESYNANYYHYETSYKQPMSVKVEVPGKGVVFNQGIDQFNTYTLIKTNTTDDYNSVRNMNADAYVKSLQEKVLADNLKYINQLVNEKYGFAKQKRETILYNVKAKGDNNYDDYQSAYENAVSGYNLLTSDPTGAKGKIKTAIDLWEKALTEYKPGEKKARVNDDVALSTRLNLAEACMWADDYTKADEHLIKTTALDPSKRQRKWSEELKTLMSEQKKRFEANK